MDQWTPQKRLETVKGHQNFQVVRVSRPLVR